MEETSFLGSSVPRQKRRIPKRLIFLLIFVVVVLLLLGSRFLSSSNQEDLSPTPSPTEFLLPTDTPTPSEEEEAEVSETPTPSVKPTSNPVDKASGLNRSQIKVAIQNGSGEAGVGAKASDYLKGLGYNVVSVSNADNYDYQGTTVKVASSKSDFLALLKKDLGFEYTVSNSSSDLSSSSSAEALVIIGK